MGHLRVGKHPPAESGPETEERKVPNQTTRGPSDADPENCSTFEYTEGDSKPVSIPCQRPLPGTPGSPKTVFDSAPSSHAKNSDDRKPTGTGSRSPSLPVETKYVTEEGEHKPIPISEEVIPPTAQTPVKQTATTAVECDSDSGEKCSRSSVETTGSTEKKPSENETRERSSKHDEEDY